MNIRLYYKPSGKVVSVVIIDKEDDFNLLEINPPVSKLKNTKEVTFTLTKDNLELYMDNPHEVNLDEVSVLTE